MTAIEACKLFAVRENRAAFPIRATACGFDVWPLAAAAAVDLAGYLDDATNDRDLDDGLTHFLALKRCGVISARKLAETAVAIKSELMAAW